MKDIIKTFLKLLWESLMLIVLLVLIIITLYESFLGIDPDNFRILSILLLAILTNKK